MWRRRRRRGSARAGRSRTACLRAALALWIGGWLPGGHGSEIVRTVPCPGVEVILSVPSSVWTTLADVSQPRAVGGLCRVKPPTVVFDPHSEHPVAVVQAELDLGAGAGVFCDVLDRFGAAEVNGWPRLGRCREGRYL